MRGGTTTRSTIDLTFTLNQESQAGLRYMIALECRAATSTLVLLLCPGRSTSLCCAIAPLPCAIVLIIGTRTKSIPSRKSIPVGSDRVNYELFLSSYPLHFCFLSLDPFTQRHVSSSIVTGCCSSFVPLHTRGWDVCGTLQCPHVLERSLLNSVHCDLQVDHGAAVKKEETWLDGVGDVDRSIRP